MLLFCRWRVSGRRRRAVICAAGSHTRRGTLPRVLLCNPLPLPLLLAALPIATAPRRAADIEAGMPPLLSLPFVAPTLPLQRGSRGAGAARRRRCRVGLAPTRAPCPCTCPGCSPGVHFLALRLATGSRQRPLHPLVTRGGLRCCGMHPRRRPAARFRGLHGTGGTGPVRMTRGRLCRRRLKIAIEGRRVAATAEVARVEAVAVRAKCGAGAPGTRHATCWPA